MPAPNGGDLHAFAWDHVNKEYITLDGSRNGRQAFAFNLTTRTWRPLTNADFSGLDGRTFVSGSGTAVSPDHDLIVIFGGGLYASNVTRILDLRNRTYREVVGPAALQRRSYVQNQFLYISSIKQFLLFGGWNNQYLNDLWLFDPRSQTWTQVAHQNPPTGRYFAQMAYDPVQNIVYLTGGHNGSGRVSILHIATWTWEHLPLPPGRVLIDYPGQRSVGTAMFDPGSGFCTTAGELEGGTWLDNLRTWCFKHQVLPPGLRIGVFRPSTGKWYLDLNGNGMLDGCTIDACIDSFSQIGGKPIVGDWKGTGVVSLGVFDRNSATWKLDGNGNDRWDGCTVDICLGPYGNSVYTPVAGRWQASQPADRVGFYNPANGSWRIDYNGNGKYDDDCGPKDRCYGPFGGPGQVAIVGDWTGTKQTRIGTFTPRTGKWVLDLNGNGQLDACTIDGCYGPFGLAGDLPVTGDWDLSGKARIGVFDPSSGQWELDLNGNGKFDDCKIDRCFGPFGQAGDLPVVGNW